LCVHGCGVRHRVFVASRSSIERPQ
jgi:carbonic anhydrase/acetyltransferase-like protein (isoleucine patch superfamily)